MRIKTIILIVLVCILTIAIVAGLFGLLVGEVPAGSTQTLPTAEVQEYQGERLSSVRDFRENSIHGPQNVDLGSYRLLITGLVNTPQNITYRDVLEKFPQFRKVVKLYCVEGWKVTILWEGVRVSDLVSSSDPLSSAKYVIFYAEDGYSTSLPLEYLENREILLASRMNNLTLPAERGFPFQLVAEDKWGYKWIKWVKEIRLSEDADYRGYWESRGYSNDADLNRGYFG